MVPPYLTMPLMDDVLIPYQNGRPIDADSGRAAAGRPVRRSAGGLGPRLGAHLHPRWWPSTSARTCAPLPSST
ncbi:MAG: hypothetical protein M5R42_18325 [Rhodocyclaceae bacterium]|nr:hypothetical protein [Rhodocyclaceae bacterium]